MGSSAFFVAEPGYVCSSLEKRFLEASGYQVRIERRIIDFDPGDLVPKLLVVCNTVPVVECVRILVKARLRRPAIETLVVAGYDSSPANSVSRCRPAIDLLCAVAQRMGYHSTPFSHMY
jgi:hypothetical protein